MTRASTHLIAPHENLFSSWRDAVAEFDGAPVEGSGSWRVQDFGPDRPSFEALNQVIAAEGDRATPVPDGLVHCTYFWLSDGDPHDPVTGFIALRHSLDTEYLARLGGHIGYAVRPSRRRRGHAGRALGLVLAQARDLGLDRVLITCTHDNAASARTITGQGGVLENELDGYLRYWITLS